jgi:hypothetical protein
MPFGRSMDGRGSWLAFSSLAWFCSCLTDGPLGWRGRSVAAGVRLVLRLFVRICGSILLSARFLLHKVYGRSVESWRTVREMCTACGFLAKGGGRSVGVCRTVRGANGRSVGSDRTVHIGRCVYGGSFGIYGWSVLGSRTVRRRWRTVRATHTDSPSLACRFGEVLFLLSCASAWDLFGACS